MKNKIISRALAMILAGTLVLLTPVTTSTVFAKEKYYNNRISYNCIFR